MVRLAATEDEIRYGEIAQRPPGVRLIVLQGEMILVIKEFRHEYGAWDYRLPGGKVYDDLATWKRAAEQGAIPAGVLEGARRELQEECGLEFLSGDEVFVSRAGATVFWDLHYVRCMEHSGAIPSRAGVDGEEIYPTWIRLDEMLSFCMAGLIKEDRTVAVLLRLFADVSIKAQFLGS